MIRPPLENDRFRGFRRSDHLVRTEWELAPFAARSSMQLSKFRSGILRREPAPRKRQDPLVSEVWSPKRKTSTFHEADGRRLLRADQGKSGGGS